MRILHARHDHVRSGIALQDSRPHARRDHSRDERQHLPLRHLLSHHRGNRKGRQDDEGRQAMNGPTLDELSIDPERYELLDSLFNAKQTRRDFFRIAGAGVIVALLMEKEVTAQQFKGGNVPREIGAWIHIGEDNVITVYSGKVEIGQNIRTSLTQVVAEELHAPLKSVRMVMADTAKVPFDAGTFGSRTTPTMASQLRLAAA